MVAVKHVGGPRSSRTGHRLSFYSLKDPLAAPRDYVDLPFQEDKSVDGMICRGMLYFHDTEGNSVIFNLKNKEIKQLSPPSNLLPSTNLVIFNGCGIGYDARRNDYKVLRNFGQIGCEENESGFDCFSDSEEYTQLYSLKDDSWKDIPSVDAFIHPGNAVYVEETGCCYWQAFLGDSFDAPANTVACVSFDFAREEFYHFYLPPLSSLDYCYMLFSFNDSLGVAIYPRRSEPLDPYYSSGSGPWTYTMYKWEGGEGWLKYHEIIVTQPAPIERPVDVISCRFFFVEQGDEQLSNLVVCDMDTKRWIMLNIVGDAGQFNVFPYHVKRHRRYYSCKLFYNFLMLFPIMMI